MGTELAGAILALTLLGWWVDRRFETDPWGVLIGACLGIVGGLYNLVRVAVREALGVEKKEEEDRQQTKADDK
jgi:F0F1-type ATP synthase assembly protein I